ncbi:MAG: ABC transporter ATP-binding protein [Anaerolineae bacterium]|nr:ABC transporter ATP-binding protein [Anaerolineae bacterium]
MDDLAIRTTGLSKVYGRAPGVRAVDQLTMDVPRGVVFGFLGPNGAGKSTTLKMLTGLLKPTEGTATVAGHDILAQSIEVKRRIGVVPENLNLYERLTANEYLELVGRLRGLGAADITSRRQQLLETLDLADRSDNPSVDYSHGMKKKLALAGALLHRPEILFLDEPFEGVDAVSSRVIKDLLRQMVDRRGVTVFFSTHIMELVERMADIVAVINKGHLVATGTLDMLRQQAASDGDASLEDVFLDLVNAELAEQDMSWLTSGA